MIENLAVVGKPLPRVDGIIKANGDAKFTVDIDLPGTLTGMILRSPHPHAKILNIDTSRAKRLPGVKAVITGHDLGDVKISFVDTPRYPADEPPLKTDKVRYIGDEVAAVAAIDEDTALEALELIDVEYEVLPGVFDPEEAMKEGAPIIHPAQYASTSAWEEWGAKKTRSSTATYDHVNLSGQSDMEWGDIERGWGECAYIFEGRYETPAVAHCAMEPHAAIAHYDATGKLNMWLANMGIFYKRYILARCLGIDQSRLRIQKSYVGGAFGGKMDVFPYEFCAAELSRRTHKPVRFECTREEVFTTTRQRHPTISYLKMGFTKDYKLHCLDTKFIVDNGAYRGTGAIVIFLGHAYNIPCYRIEHYRYKGYSVYTNHPIRGAQRGHGAPQIRYAMDSLFDEAAVAMGIDTADLMRLNAHQTGDVLWNGDPLNSCGLTDAINRATTRADWWAQRQASRGARLAPAASTAVTKRGIGLSVCSMFSGAPYYPFASAAIIKMHDDGKATLITGVTEMGQGAETTLAQVAAEELGVSLDDIHVHANDTETTTIDMGSFLSGGAFVTGNAVRAAAAEVKRQLFEAAAAMLEAHVDDLVARGGKIFIKGSENHGIAIAKVVEHITHETLGDPVIGKGFYKAVPGVNRYPSLAKGKGRWTDAYGFAAQISEVEVNTVTGAVKLLRVTTAHDCGYPLNSNIVEGQIDGNVHMGLGQALHENIELHDGQLFNPSFLSYAFPTISDTPEVVNELIHTYDPKGPFGAKEVGEGVVAGMLASIANAVADALGVRIRELPITPEKVLKALEQKRRDERSGKNGGNGKH
ncbi:MAG: molybdopterin-dependent oxidoreductase [Candidatus Tectomicrobia bacterium]|nr:molybdopterin-dependent oxidoreductase [Candidatus Tectomicrobia bacterium]